MRRLAAAVTALIAGAIVLGGCGRDDFTPAAAGMEPSETAAFNEADVAFAQGMIPHHQQAIEMARLAADRAASPEVKALATDIEAAQGPEIALMTGWLQLWGAAVPEDTAGMEHPGMEVPGMMSQADMQALEQASGAEFDRMFLDMMIRHHEGALEMARTEQADGQNADALALARQIETTQAVEIDAMRELLGS